MKFNKSMLFDIVIFQVAWFACVLSSLSPLPLVLPFLGLAMVAVRSIYTQGLLILFPFIVSSLFIGLVGDACLVKFGFITFGDYPGLFGVPLWMLILWLNFGLMLRPVFEWFLDHRWRCLIGFSVGGALAYYSGDKLEVLSFTQDWTSALAVALEWGIAGIIFRYLHLQFCTTPEYYEYD